MFGDSALIVALGLTGLSRSSHSLSSYPGPFELIHIRHAFYYVTMGVWYLKSQFSQKFLSRFPSFFLLVSTFLLLLLFPNPSGQPPVRQGALLRKGPDFLFS